MAYLVEVTIPTQFDYLALLDQTGADWYYYVDGGGQLVREHSSPADPAGLRPNRLTSTTTPRWVTITDNTATTRYLHPETLTGTLLIRSTAPAIGPGQDFGASITLRSQKPGQTYVLDAVAVPLAWTLTAGALVAINDFRYFAAKTLFPVYDGKLWDTHLKTVFNVENSVFAGTDLAHRAIPRFGTMELAIGDGDLEADLLSYSWEGRRLCVYRGEEAAPFSSFTKVLQTYSREALWDQDIFLIQLTDRAALFEKPIQERVYTGSGGMEGGSDLAGTTKPLAYGEVRNITPTLIDRGLLIYQVHDGSCEGIDHVYDRAVELRHLGDILPAGLPNLQAWMPVPGTVLTDVRLGLLRLGAEPQGPLTADVRGDNTPAYALTAADILQRIALTHGGLFQSGAYVFDGYVDPGYIASILTLSDLDEAAFAALNAANSSPCGLYIATGDLSTMGHVFDRLMESIGAWWGVTNLDQLTVGMLEISATPVGSISLLDQMDFRRLETPAAWWRAKIGYAAAWTVQPQEQVSPIEAPQDLKDFVIRPYRYATAENPRIQVRRPLALDRQRDTLLARQEDAQAEAIRLLAQFGVERHVYQVTLNSNNVMHQFAFQVGETITVHNPRFGFAAGRPMLILSVVENSESEFVELILWG